MAEVRSSKVAAASVVLAIAGLAAVAYFAARWLSAPTDEDADVADGDEPPAADEPLPELGRGERFETVRPLVRDVYESFPGKLSAQGGFPVRALPGQRMAIVRILKWDGDEVKKGEVLMELRSDEYEKDLEKALAAKDEERAKYLRTMIDAAKVRSPVDGIVKEVHRDIGEIPLDEQEGGGLPLVTVIDPNSFTFTVVVPQQVVGTSGQLGARFTVELENGTKAEGKVTGYGDAPDGSAELQLGMEPTAGLEQDLHGNVRVPSSKEEVALVPKKAVARRGGVAIVRVFDPETKAVVERTVVLGAEVAEDVVVTAGVYAGEAVVVPDR